MSGITEDGHLFLNLERKSNGADASEVSFATLAHYFVQSDCTPHDRESLWSRPLTNLRRQTT